MELSDTAWTKLVEASPYAVIMVIVASLKISLSKSTEFFK